MRSHEDGVFDSALVLPIGLSLSGPPRGAGGAELLALTGS